MSSDRIAISVEGLGKKYRLGASGSYGRLTESLSSIPRRLIGGRGADTQEFWALKNVTFDVPVGEVVGVVGRNGAGKSTLLKILSRVTRPTVGSAVLGGRVGSLLEVGTGFHPELTGRENIHMSGAILGMHRREIDSRFDEIVDFADIGPFLDTPVKRYSSGMQVRLGFAVAAHLETEILLIDEVLAVGDFSFQRKCIDHMSSAAQTGRTILLVSHNLSSIRRLCRTTLVLEHGQVLASGPTEDSLDAYLRSLKMLKETNLRARDDRQGSGALRIDSFCAQDSASGGLPTSGHAARLVVEYRTYEPCKDVVIGLGVYNNEGQAVLGLRNDLTGDEFDSLRAQGEMVCRIPKLPLIPGEYTVNIYVEVNGTVADWIQAADTFEVVAGDYFGTGRPPLSEFGSVLTPYSWESD